MFNADQPGASGSSRNLEPLTLCSSLHPPDPQKITMTTEKKERDAGRELDAEIAERVFDAVVNRSERGGWGMFNRDGERLWLNADARVPDFSSSVASAFLVVEAMRAKGWHLSISDQVSSGDWFVEMWHGADSMLTNYVDQSPTLPLAICRAALKALEASSAKSAVPETETPVSPASL